MSKIFDLTGKSALITGGSRGLGLAMARGFAAAGADIVVVSRKKDACVSAAEAIADEHAVKTWGLGSNVSSSGSMHGTGERR